MTNAQLGILIGGIVPAVLFGISGLFQKFSAQQGVSLGAHIVAIGIGVCLVGIVICGMHQQQDYSVKRLIPSLIIGASWGTGMLLVAIAITKYNASLSVVTPLYNMNTLITVLAALIIFAEWKDANLTKLIIGTGLIILGGILVSGANEPSEDKALKEIENKPDFQE